MNLNNTSPPLIDVAMLLSRRMPGHQISLIATGDKLPEETSLEHDDTKNRREDKCVALGGRASL